MIVQRRAERPAVPWRNGLGVQFEVEADHPSDWTWRLSTAEIDRDVPFSSFPGVHRVFCVGGGSGVTLTVNGREVACGPRAITRFSGDDVVDARIWDGPVQAINLMWRGDAPWRDIVVLGQGDELAGACAVVASGAATVSVAGTTHDLGHLDALLQIERDAALSVVRGTVAAIVRHS